MPSSTKYAPGFWPGGFSTTRCARSRNCLSMRSTQRSPGSFTCESAEISFGSLMISPSLAFQLQVFVRRREGPPVDEREARLRHARSLRVDEAELPHRRDHGFVVDELLDPMEHRLAPLPVDLGRLLSEESLDVGVAAVGVGAAGGDPRLEPGRRVPEGAGDRVDQVLQLLLLVRLEERRALERAELQSDSYALQIPDQRLAHRRRRGIAPQITGVE